MAGKASKKSKKHGRNKPWCEAYKKSGKREKAKKARLLKHLATNKNAHSDKTAWSGLKALVPPSHYEQLRREHSPT